MLQVFQLESLEASVNLTVTNGLLLAPAGCVPALYAAAFSARVERSVESSSRLLPLVSGSVKIVSRCRR
jgi:hypothetical protein